MADRSWGWRPDLPDHRDHVFSAAAYPVGLKVPPSRVDLQPGCPPVVDQLDLGSCTANAIAAALEFDEIKQGQHEEPLSRLFIYFSERAAEGTIATDSGAAIRDGIKAVNRIGACREKTWPYAVDRFADEPPKAAYAEAGKYRSVSYQRVPRGSSYLRAAIAAQIPVVFGFSVFESFESDEVARTGVVPMPGRGEELRGGHAVLAVGYDDRTQRYKIRNSWGPDWAVGGYCWMPYQYLSNRGLASDFWQIRSVTA